MKIKDYEIQVKGTLNTLGFASALMAGFAFSAIVELDSWNPTVRLWGFYKTLGFFLPDDANLLKESIYFLLMVGFAGFMMPLMLNMFFLNVEINDEVNLKKLRKVQMMYTVFIGGGIGCLEGSLCLFALGTLDPFNAFFIIFVMITTLLCTLGVVRWFKRDLSFAPDSIEENIEQKEPEKKEPEKKEPVEEISESEESEAEQPKSE